ncbi:MAG: carboxylating nicotinate-nucleotide diphosphorylase [Chitinophagia bacterium]|nr:carboxylating nicotinate-nucleotide diphosphorylase [Chitinophagia bacterium]
MNQALAEFIQQAIAEDTAQIGDITTMATIPKDQVGQAHFLVKEACIIAGVEMVTCIAQMIDAHLKVEFNVQDGDTVHQHQVIGHLQGRIHSIVLAERLMLNCMQRMSGIATKTHQLKSMIAAYPAKILDTRKTTPNFRIAEKWAVRIGGGVNHRFGLYDMILIKDNHIKAAGGVRLALEATRQYCTAEKINLPVVVEVKNQDELLEALAFDFCTRILLDNMTPATVSTMVAINQNKKPLEVSGGVNQDNIVAYAATGVDFISIGDLTHHIESVDISLKIV